jgi:hypothetical protein
VVKEGVMRECVGRALLLGNQGAWPGKFTIRRWENTHFYAVSSCLGKDFYSYKFMGLPEGVVLRQLTTIEQTERYSNAKGS